MPKGAKDQRTLAAIVAGLWVPLHSFIPLWLILLMLAVLIVRQVGSLTTIGFNILALLIFIPTMVLLHRAFNTWIGPEFGISLLCLLLSLKYLEIRTERDAQPVILTSFFLIGCSYLFQQHVVWVLYGIILIFLLIRCLYQIPEAKHSTHTSHNLFPFILLLQSIPLLLLFFILFPRIPPLWTVAVPNEASTGLSPDMAPGDIAHLNTSFTKVFQVHFDGAIPHSTARYWRVMILDTFDGKAWHAGYAPTRNKDTRPLRIHGHQLYRYQVQLSTTMQDQAPSLAIPIYTSTRPVITTTDALLHLDDTRTPPLPYTVISDTDAPLEADSSVLQLQHNLLLPMYSNRRTLALAQQWRAGLSSNWDYVQFVLHFFQKNFKYTLNPPLLEHDAIDDFIFHSRRGFCEHFASAMAVLLRAAAIPARVVIGYQGGRLDNHTLTVRQLDAHAWVEAWLDHRWVRLDPTSVVAPERIQTSENQWAQQLWGTSSSSWWAWRRYELTARLSWFSDHVNDLWQRHIVTYNADSVSVPGPSRWSGQQRRTLYLAVGFLGIILVLSAWLLRPQTLDIDPVTATYRHYLNRMRKWQLEPEPGETAEHWARRIALQFPAQSVLLTQHAQLYTYLKYADYIHGTLYHKHIRRWRQLQQKLLQQLQHSVAHTPRNPG